MQWFLAALLYGGVLPVVAPRSAVDQPLLRARVQRTIIVPVVAAGLANRLRLMASAQQLAHDSQRELWVLWHGGRDCNVTWDALFSETPSFHLVRDAEDAAWVRSMITFDETLTVTVDVRAREAPPPPIVHVVLRRNVMNSAAVETIFAPEHRSVLLLPSSGLFFKRRSQSCGDFYMRKAGWYRALATAVAPRLRSVVERVVRNPLLAHGVVVGVHARATDRHFDGAEVGGRYHEDVAPAQSFVHAMVAVARHRATQLSIEPRNRQQTKTLFFVASNAQRQKEAIARAFAESKEMQQIAVVHTLESLLLADAKKAATSTSPLHGVTAQNVVTVHLPAEWQSEVRSAPGGIELALVEWLVLAQTSSLILHPYRSSFAEEAAAVHGVAALQLVDGVAVLGIDATALSCHCNSIRFAVEESALRRRDERHASGEGEWDKARWKAVLEGSGSSDNDDDEPPPGDNAAAAEDDVPGEVQLVQSRGALSMTWGIPLIRALAPALCV